MSKKIKKAAPLILKIEGTRITAEKFLKAAKNFFGLIKNVSDDLTDQKNAVRWIVTAEKGSQILTATPEADESIIKNLRSIPKVIHSGFRQIEEKQSRPRAFSDTALRHAKELASVVGNHDGDVNKITLRYGTELSVLTEKTSLCVSDILGAKRTEDGSVEGWVRLLEDKRRKLIVHIVDALTGHKVRCTPREANEEELITSFRRRIVATGTVHFRDDGSPVSIEVDSVRLLGKKEDLPSFEDVRGIFRQGD